MQESIKATRLLRARHPWQEARQPLDQTLARFNQVSTSPARFRYFVSFLAIPNFSKAANTAVRTETERQMTLAAIALKRFCLVRGALPSSLENLVPYFQASVPWDPMSGKPLGYHVNAGGTYTLYSVGEDGKDDGGDPTVATANRLGLWEGRDAVWPSLVPAASSRR